MINDTGIYTCV